MSKHAQIKQPVVLAVIMLTGFLAYLAVAGFFESEGWQQPECITHGFIIFFGCCSIVSATQGLWQFKQRAAERADLLATHQRFVDVEDRFDQLERLKRRDMVTPEEYAIKRQEILKDL